MARKPRGHRAPGGPDWRGTPGPGRLFRAEWASPAPGDPGRLVLQRLRHHVATMHYRSWLFGPHEELSSRAPVSRKRKNGILEPPDAVVPLGAAVAEPVYLPLLTRV